MIEDLSSNLKQSNRESKVSDKRNRKNPEDLGEKKMKCDNDSTKDVKSKSASEAFVNSFGSYPIGYGLGIVILPISMEWLQDDLMVANLFVTLVYATVSFVRTYYLRRAFERVGFDDNFLKLGIKLIKKVDRRQK
ncbi:MAG: DUF7220 family protein [Candidatus Nitrosopumilus sp. bin_68KS]